MDIDPLADVPPPRYALESDDEDEDDGPPLSSLSLLRRSVEVEITFKTESQNQELERHIPLIVASGQAGNVLAHILGRPSISSRVYANSVEVFYLLFFLRTPLTASPQDWVLCPTITNLTKKQTHDPDFRI
jgi:hypothetical protein